MRRAGWVHGVRALALATMLILLVWGGYEGYLRLTTQIRLERLLLYPL
jgi:hypothetical protein